MHAFEQRAEQLDSQGNLIQQATPALISFWRIISEYRFWVLIPALVAVLLGFIAGELMRPIYQASATVLIETAKSNVVSIKEVYPGLSADREHIRTQTQFLRSREVGLRVVRDLRLTEHPQFARVVAAATDGSGGDITTPSRRGESADALVNATSSGAEQPRLRRPDRR